MEWLARNGVRDIVYLIGYRGDQIAAALGDGAAFGLSIRYADEGERRLGTAGAIRHAIDLGMLASGFFVLYGNSFLPIDIAPVWRASSEGRWPLMTVIRNANRWDRSNACFEHGRVRLYDKRVADPIAAGMEFIDYGLSVYPRDEIARLVPAQVPWDLSDVAHELSREGKLRGHEVFEQFYEIGSPAGLADLEALLAQPRT